MPLLKRGEVKLLRDTASPSVTSNNSRAIRYYSKWDGVEVVPTESKIAEEEAAREG